jgi:hypothetical protein
MDAIIAIDCIPGRTKDLTRFEQRGIYAARVLNASIVGSQLLGSVVYKLFFFKALYRFCTKTHFA